MNTGQSHPSPAIRLFTDERVLAGYRGLLVLGLGIIGFFLLRLVATVDDGARQMDAFKSAIQLQMSDFKIDVARNTANSIATISAIQSRMDAQSRRMDGFDVDMREVNKKLYEGRTVRP